MKVSLRAMRMKWVIPPGQNMLVAQPTERTIIQLPNEKLLEYHNGLVDHYAKAETALKKALECCDYLMLSTDQGELEFKFAEDFKKELEELLQITPLMAATPENPLEEKAPVDPNAPNYSVAAVDGVKSVGGPSDGTKALFAGVASQQPVAPAVEADV